MQLNSYVIAKSPEYDKNVDITHAAKHKLSHKSHSRWYWPWHKLYWNGEKFKRVFEMLRLSFSIFLVMKLTPFMECWNSVFQKENSAKMKLSVPFIAIDQSLNRKRIGLNDEWRSKMVKLIILLEYVCMKYEYWKWKRVRGQAMVGK